MTAESVLPEVLHVWAIYLQASEEARRRGDSRSGFPEYQEMLIAASQPSQVSLRPTFAVSLSGRGTQSGRSGWLNSR